MLQQVVQILLVIFDDGLDARGRLLSGPVEGGGGFRELLLVTRESFERLANRGDIFGVNFLNVAQSLLRLGDGIVIGRQISRIMEQQIIPFGAARFQHFDGGLLRESGSRRINVHDAVDDASHLK